MSTYHHSAAWAENPEPTYLREMWCVNCDHRGYIQIKKGEQAIGGFMGFRTRKCPQCGCRTLHPS